MIVDDRITTYLHSLEMPDIPVIEEIEKEALEAYVPIIRKETQSFLKVLLTIQKPKRILEVGTAVGFSAVLMSHYMPKDGHIITIENYEKRIPVARANFARAEKEDKITLLMSDNVLQDGDITQSRFAVERRNRTIHSRMREYLYELKHHEGLRTSILPLGDGVALSVKKEEEK